MFWIGAGAALEHSEAEWQQGDPAYMIRSEVAGGNHAGALGGAAGATYRLFQNMDHEAILFTHDGLVKLKHTVFCGAALSVLGYLLPSPLKQTLGIKQTTAADAG